MKNSKNNLQNSKTTNNNKKKQKKVNLLTFFKKNPQKRFFFLLFHFPQNLQSLHYFIFNKCNFQKNYFSNQMQLCLKQKQNNFEYFLRLVAIDAIKQKCKNFDMRKIAKQFVSQLKKSQTKN